MNRRAFLCSVPTIRFGAQPLVARGLPPLAHELSGAAMCPACNSYLDPTDGGGVSVHAALPNIAYPIKCQCGWSGEFVMKRTQR